VGSEKLSLAEFLKEMCLTASSKESDDSHSHRYYSPSISEEELSETASRSVMPSILENAYFSEDLENTYNKDNSKSDDTSDIIIKIKIIPLKMKCMKILVSHGEGLCMINTQN
jgi:hypothetical protein